MSVEGLESFHLRVIRCSLRPTHDITLQPEGTDVCRTFFCQLTVYGYCQWIAGNYLSRRLLLLWLRAGGSTASTGIGIS